MANEESRDRVGPLFDLDPQPPAPGRVSSRCRFYDEGAQRFILIEDRIWLTYGLDDKTALRQAWSSICEHGYATQRQAAEAAGIPLRSLHRWVNLRRRGGASRLADLPRSGAPRKVTSAMGRRIARLRAQRSSIREIARQCGISVSSVRAAVARQEQEREAQRELQSSLGPPAGETAEAAVAAGEAGAAPALPGEVAEDRPMTSPPALSEAREQACALDRSGDRALAQRGLLRDAPPLFAEGERIEYAGVFLAAALLGLDPYLETAGRLFAQAVSGFYGLSAVLRTLVFMLLLRLKRPEDLRQRDPVQFGRILGLDRAPEVKTLRRKVQELSRADQATEWMAVLSERRYGSGERPPEVVYLDGHVQVYSGAVQIGRVYAPARKSVVKGRTETWANRQGGQPLFVLQTSFNEGLSQTIAPLLPKLVEITKSRSLTCVFDRGGYDGRLFETLLAEGHHLLTYRKGRFARADESCFEKRPTRIGERVYSYAPYEREAKLPVYEEKSRAKGRAYRRKTKRVVTLREIMVRREDGGQASILSSRADWSAVECARTMFARWADQENVFKYLLEEFDLDGLWSYGAEDIPEPELDHPNPEFVKLERRAEVLRERRRRCLAELGEAVQGLEGKSLAAPVRELRGGETAERVERIDAALEAVRLQMAQTSRREPVSAAGYRRLKAESRQLINTVRLTAYLIETRLFEMLRPFYANAAKDGRRLIAAALRTSGSLRLEPGRLVVRLGPQASPNRTRAINALAAAVTGLRLKYPGSSRVIAFEPTPLR